MTIERISPQQAHSDIVDSGALLICAYDSQEQCAHNRLEGALSLPEFQSHEDTVSNDRELIFY